MSVKIELNDGSRAVLQRVIQDDNYRRGYSVMPHDPIAELEKAARLRLPEYWANQLKSRVTVVLPHERWLYERFKTDSEKWMVKLPPIICVGSFWSLRDPEGEARNSFATFAWFQADMVPHISDENRIALRQLDWDEVSRPL